MRQFAPMTNGELRDLLASLQLSFTDEPDAAREGLAWEVEEELHRRHLEAREAE